jgi:hypothetical protein
MEEDPLNNSAQFYVLGSYGIPENKTFVLFGVVKSGTVRPGMYAKIGLNSSLNLSKVQFPKDKSIDTLLFVRNDDTFFYDFLLSMQVERETIQIDEDGED